MVGEGSDQAGDEGVAPHVGQDLALIAHMVDLLELDDCEFLSIFCVSWPQFVLRDGDQPSVLRSILSAYTLLRSASLPWAGRTRHTRAKVPRALQCQSATCSPHRATLLYGVLYLFLMSALLQNH